MLPCIARPSAFAQLRTSHLNIAAPHRTKCATLPGAKLPALRGTLPSSNPLARPPARPPTPPTFVLPSLVLLAASPAAAEARSSSRTIPAPASRRSANSFRMRARVSYASYPPAACGGV